MHFLKDSYKLATKQPFGHLLIDLDPKTLDVLRYCSNIVPPGPSVFYLPPAKADITNLSKERERALYAAANVREIGHNIKRTKELIKSAPNSFINFLCECLLNVVNGNVPVKKTLIQGRENSFKKLLSNQIFLYNKRQIVAKNMVLLKVIALSCYFHLRK